MAKSKRFRTVTSRDPHIIKLGKYKADNVCLEEAAINNLVLRIRVEGVAKIKEKYRRLTKRLISSRSLKHMIQSSFKEKVMNERNGFKVVNEKPSKIVQSRAKDNKRYFLKFVPGNYIRSRTSKVNVNFTKLAEMVCSMRLPSKSWKVTVMMNSNLMTVFTFSNHKPARCVTFSENNPYYKIVMDGVPVILVGCPQTVDTIRDVEILLDIVNNLSLKDCMVSKV